MMNITYEPKLLERTMLADLAKGANEVLEQAIGDPAPRVNVTWGCYDDAKGGTHLRLTLADWSETISADFEPKDLFPAENSRYKFIRLWGDLLQKASARVSKRLEAALTESDGL